MELKLSNCSYGRFLKNINIDFYYGNVYGLYGENSFYFDKLISRNINKKKIVSLFKRNDKKIVVIDINHMKFYTESIKLEINYYCRANNFTDKSLRKVIENYIERFGFSKTDLDKLFSEMSYSEKVLFYIFINTLFDFDIVVFKNSFSHLDKKGQKVIRDLFLKLKEENKLIFLNDKDINIIYNLCDYIVYFDEAKIFDCIDTKEYFNHIDNLVKNNFSIPDKLYLIYLEKSKKNIKLTYLDDVRDIIKDIYKHV